MRRAVITVIKLYMLYCFLLSTDATKRHQVQDKADKQDLRVINGEPDTNNDFPFAVALQAHYFKNKIPIAQTICTGSLIAASWVLTAGHCMAGYLNMVRYGAINASLAAENTFSRVLKQIPHPCYELKQTNIGVLSLRNDIGLIQITPVPVNKQFVKLSAVDYQSLIGLPVKLAGFGMDDMYNPSKNIPLQVAEGVVIKCQKKVAVKSGPTICLASKCLRHQKAYSGDSGGPLVAGGKQVGVASTTIPEIPELGFYWPVSPYLQWIQDTMRNVQVPVTQNATAYRRNGRSSWEEISTKNKK